MVWSRGSPSWRCLLINEAGEAARSLGLKLHVVKASSESEIEAAFGVLKEHGAGILLVGGDAFLGGRVTQIASLSLRHGIPSSFVRREFPAAGGLMSYGADFADIYRKVGAYVRRILKGEKPEELPVLQPTTFELVINLKTAKALGLDVPWHLQQIADEVIE
jgi:putative tryptophan/tyrosine transport system substrate-binding protein